jgi:hypothetical protein
MPEATMNEDHFPEPRKDQVRTPGKILSMQAETISKSMSDRSGCEFRCTVLSSYPPHKLATLVCHVIHRASRHGRYPSFDLNDLMQSLG